MQDVSAILARLPERAWDIRRRCARDARFRSICSDYGEALAALAHWTNAAGAGDRRAVGYAELVAELEREIVAELDDARGAGDG
jgi:hypothetical protein